MLKLTTLLLVAIACACHAEPNPDAFVTAATPNADAAPVPKPGAIAMGGNEASLLGALGKPSKTWRQDDFDWRQYDTERLSLTAGFYRDKLGKFSLKPKQPLAWVEAAGWARALATGFDAAKIDRSNPAEWRYFEQIVVQSAPFEVGLTFAMEGERVLALTGELSWLD